MRLAGGSATGSCTKAASEQRRAALALLGACCAALCCAHAASEHHLPLKCPLLPHLDSIHLHQGDLGVHLAITHS